jgi:hypothetical protein
MNKLLIGLIACASGLAIGNAVIAAEELALDKGTPPATQTNPQATPPDKSRAEPGNGAYTADLKKCDAMSNRDKAACEKKVNKKYREM